MNTRARVKADEELLLAILNQSANVAAAQTTATAAAATTSNAPSPMPARVSTPMRNTSAANGLEGAERTGSRAASAHPDTAGFTMPAEAAQHGAPVRQYINSKVTGPLLEGMKLVAKERYALTYLSVSKRLGLLMNVFGTNRPKDPLRMLGEFLLQRSKELEGTGL